MGLWHLTTARSNSSSYTWCYNNETDYNIGNNSGVLVSPVIKLTGFSEPVLRFSSWYQTEDEGIWWDKKKVFISTEDGGYKDLKEVKQISGKMKEWIEHEVSLKKYADKRIRLNFLFDTVDGLYNDYEGWYIDNVRIEDGKGQKGPKILLLSEGSAKVIMDVTSSYDVDKAIANSKENTSYLYANGQLVANIEEKPIDTAIKVYYYHNDHLGSPRAMTDKNSKVVWRQDYYPFGGAIWTQTGTYKSSLTFSSKELDDTGLFYFGARYYEPGMGRFITPDPVDVYGENLYTYCYNNPLRYTDPTGECVDPLTIAIVAFFVGGTHEYWRGMDNPHFDFVTGIMSAAFAYCMGDMLMNPETWKFGYDLSYISPYGALTLSGMGSYNGEGGFQGYTSYEIETPYGSYYNTRSRDGVNYMGGRPTGSALGDIKPSNVEKVGVLTKAYDVGNAAKKTIELFRNAPKKAEECAEKDEAYMAAFFELYRRDPSKKEKRAHGVCTQAYKEWYSKESQELVNAWASIAVW